LSVNASFALYLSICGLRTGPEKLFVGVLERPGKVLEFLSVKEWEPYFTQIFCHMDLFYAST